MRGYEGTPIKASLETHRKALLAHERILRQLSAAFGTILQDSASGGVAVAPIPSGSVAPHAATHKPSGSDPLATAAGITLHANSANAVGSSDSFARSDHSHAITSSSPSGGYAAAAAIGAGAGFMRASAVLPYPEALGVAADRTKRGILTDDATEGAFIDFTGGTAFAANALALKAPGATNAVRFGKYGNISLAGTALDDKTLLIFAKLDYNETVLCTGVSASTKNIGTGGCRAYFGSAISTGNFGATEQVAFDQALQLQNGSATGDGVVVLARALSTSNVTRGAFTSFKSIPGSAATGTCTTFRHFWAARNGTNNVGAGTLTNHVGFDVDDMQKGTNRIGYRVTGATSGAPTVAYGFQQLLHAVGTTRRGFICDNSGELGKDLIFNTNAFGPIFKDTQGTPEFWRLLVAGTGLKDATISVDLNGLVTGTRGASATGTVTLTLQDAGTTAPAV